MTKKEKARGDFQDLITAFPYAMIDEAKSLHRVAKELEQNGSESFQSDRLLFLGIGRAVPILLSLATEIALKAWQVREGKEEPDQTHDLLKLFESLEQGTQEMLEDRMRELSPHYQWPLTRASPARHFVFSQGCVWILEVQLRDNHPRRRRQFWDRRYGQSAHRHRRRLRFALFWSACGGALGRVGGAVDGDASQVFAQFRSPTCGGLKDRSFRRLAVPYWLQAVSRTGLRSRIPPVHPSPRAEESLRTQPGPLRRMPARPDAPARIPNLPGLSTAGPMSAHPQRPGPKPGRVPRTRDHYTAGNLPAFAVRIPSQSCPVTQSQKLETPLIRRCARGRTR